MDRPRKLAELSLRAALEIDDMIESRTGSAPAFTELSAKFVLPDEAELKRKSFAGLGKVEDFSVAWMLVDSKHKDESWATTVKNISEIVKSVGSGVYDTSVLEKAKNLCLAMNTYALAVNRGGDLDDRERTEEAGLY